MRTDSTQLPSRSFQRYLIVPSFCERSFRTICGAVIGYICDRYLVRQLLSAILMSLLALVFCQTLLFLFQCYLGTIHIGMITALPVQIGLSLLACPLLYLGAWAIRKVGAK